MTTRPQAAMRALARDHQKESTEVAFPKGTRHEDH